MLSNRHRVGAVSTQGTFILGGAGGLCPTTGSDCVCVCIERVAGLGFRVQGVRV